MHVSLSSRKRNAQEQCNEPLRCPNTILIPLNLGNESWEAISWKETVLKIVIEGIDYNVIFRIVLSGNNDVQNDIYQWNASIV